MTDEAHPEDGSFWDIALSLPAEARVARGLMAVIHDNTDEDGAVRLTPEAHFRAMMEAVVLLEARVMNLEAAVGP